MNNFQALNIALLTISDTRTSTDDFSGQLLEDRVLTTGHHLAVRDILPDNRFMLRAKVSAWIASDIQVIITTGGTGLTGRDTTPEALMPLFDKTIAGFGELFREISYHEIGASTIQSRVTAGLANATLIFCLPGSVNACQVAWDKILQSQLDSRTKPCNFVTLISRFMEA